MKKFLVMMAACSMQVAMAYPPSGVFGQIGIEFDQLEAKIEALSNAVTCSVGNACFVTSIDAATSINAPGSYQLCNDITGPITIASDEVTLDLNGYTISGGANGVAVNSGLSCVTIKNGTIRDTTNRGIAVGASEVLTIEDISCISCGSASNEFGIVSLAESNVIRNCSVSEGWQGIGVLQNSLIVGCQVLGCTQSTANDTRGFSPGVNSFMQDCVVKELSTSGNVASGIRGPLSCFAKNCELEAIQGNNLCVGINAGDFVRLDAVKIKDLGPTGSAIGVNSSVTNLICHDCSIQNMLGSGSFNSGFFRCDNALYDHCIVTNAERNFEMTSGSSLAVNCIAENASDSGFEGTNLVVDCAAASVSDGYTVGGSSGGLYTRNLATFNSGTGFIGSAGSDGFVSNRSMNNSTNYSLVPFVVASGGAFQAGFNFDG